MQSMTLELESYHIKTRGILNNELKFNRYVQMLKLSYNNIFL